MVTDTTLQQYDAHYINYQDCRNILTLDELMNQRTFTAIDDV